MINYCRLEECTKLYLDYNIFTSAHWTVFNPEAGSDLMDATRTDIFICHLSAVLCLTIRSSECCADVTPDCGAEVILCSRYIYELSVIIVTAIQAHKYRLTPS